MSVRQNVRSAKRPFGKMTVGKMSVRQNAFRQSVFRQKCLSAKCPVTAVRKAKSTYYKNLLNENSTDANKFWKTLKSIYPTNNRDKTSLRSFDIGGEKTTHPSQIANAFCTFFTQVIASLKSKAIPLRNFAWKNPSPMQMRTNSKFSFRKVSQLEVMK